MPFRTMDVMEQYLFVGGANDGYRKMYWGNERFVTLVKPPTLPVKWTRDGPEPAETKVERYELTTLKIHPGHVIQFYRIEGMSEYAALLLILARYPKQTPPV